MIETNTAGQWSMPWHTHGIGDHLRARNATSGHGYRGANVVTLALEGIERGFPTGEWATYRQWRGVDAQVRKGERSAQIVKWITTNRDDPEPTPSDSDTDERGRLIPRVYAVFNAHQVDGYQATEAPEVDTGEIGRWIESIGADVVYGGDRAYYMHRADRIYAPGIDQYPTAESHYSTLIHELVHWTGHASRLDRDIVHPFASHEYASEELVAELGSAIACAELGISSKPRTDHAAYLAHWLDILGADPKALFRSAAAAQRAVDYLIDEARGDDPGDEIADEPEQPTDSRQAVAA